MVVTYGYSARDEMFHPCLDIDASNEAWIDVDIDLPKYIDSELFVLNVKKITYLKRFGFNFSKNSFKRETFRKLIALSGFDLYCASRLLNDPHKSSFKTSMKKQLRDWLNGESKFEHPWTGKQLKIMEQMWFHEYRNHIAAIQSTYKPITSFT